MKITTSIVMTTLSLIGLAHISCMATPTMDKPQDLIAPPGSETDSTVTLLWDKLVNAGGNLSYQVYQDGCFVAEVNKTNYMVGGLLPGKFYSFCVKAKDREGSLSEASDQIVVMTKKPGQVFNILSYGAKGDGKTKDTKSIQKAIDDCTPGGTVYVPKGIFLSGALYLKSHMTLYLAEGAVLKGSIDVNDYYPMIFNRFEGWEMESFASLITAGEMNHSGGYTVTNLSIRGKGKISGGGDVLAKAMIEAQGLRSRGRLICLMNCQNVNIQGITVENSPCWTIHYIYCKNITCHGLTIHSTVRNGDGLDPDSSTDSYIFNCTFNTGDDCIAIKSGKNPEGYYIARPTENIFISNCKFLAGHGLSIGSEMSGGIRNVIIRDCELGNLLNGFQIKVTKDRGGYVEGVKIADCDLRKIKIVTAIGYNNDGDPAPKLPYLKDMEFINLNMTQANINQPIISVIGFSDVENYISNLIFREIKLPEQATISLKYCKEVVFQNVLTVQNEEPVYNVIESENITY